MTEKYTPPEIQETTDPHCGFKTGERVWFLYPHGESEEPVLVPNGKIKSFTTVVDDDNKSTTLANITFIYGFGERQKISIPTDVLRAINDAQGKGKQSDNEVSASQFFHNK